MLTRILIILLDSAVLPFLMLTGLSILFIVLVVILLNLIGSGVILGIMTIADALVWFIEEGFLQPTGWVIAKLGQCLEGLARYAKRIHARNKG